MLTCLSKPTGGEAYVCGHNVSTESALVKKAVGVSPQDTAVAENLTVRENLELMAKIYGFTQEKRNERVADMQRMFKLDEVMEQRTKTLSGGWKRRVSIAMALISEPEVLFLDEPTLGLDVLARRELWSAIQSLKGSLTVILTTHYMEEAAQADRVLVMSKGHVVMEGTPKEVFSQTEKVRSLHLDVPQAAELRDELVKAGIPMPEGIIDTGECAQALYELLQ